MDEKTQVNDYEQELEEIEKELKSLKEEYWHKRDELTMLSHKIDTLERKKLFGADIAKVMTPYRGASCNTLSDS